MSKESTIHLVLKDQDGKIHRVDIPLKDPFLEPAEQVPDPAQTTHRARLRVVVAVPGMLAPFKIE